MELAILLPMLILLLLGAMDFGRVFYKAMAVTHAAEAGVQYGAQSVGKSFDTSGMTSAAAAAATDITGFSATAYPPGSAQNPCECWSASSGTETVMPTCTSSCPSPSVVRIYATVTGTAVFTTVVPYPGIPHTVPITRTAWRRAQ